VSQGRLQNVAATILAASALASTAFATEPLTAIGAGARGVSAIPSANVMEISGADALEAWKLKASASRKPWDATDPLTLARVQARDALGGESSRASLSFEWQRTLGVGRLEAAAIGRRSSIDLYSDLGRFDGASRGERFGQRDHRSLIGGALRWSGATRVGPFIANPSASVRMRSETLDADGGFGLAGAEPFDTVREDRLRQSMVGFVLDNEVRLGRNLRATGSVRYDAYRFGVRSDLDGHSGGASGSALAPHLSITASLPRGNELFLGAGRGFSPDDPRAPGAAIDPRSGAPLGRLDPLATLQSTQAGVRGTWIPGVSTTVSLFRIKSDRELLLTGDTGVTELLQPVVRQGVQVEARYEPARWLTLDAQAWALRARRAGDASRDFPAAERGASAAATMRVPNGWTASLLVNYLGRRSAAEDGGASLRASSFVNARLTRSLGKSTRVTFDVFNVFDQRVRDVDYFSTARIWNSGAADSFLFNPAEPRGIRIKLRTTF
jgi:hypothetical protein